LNSLFAAGRPDGSGCDSRTRPAALPYLGASPILARPRFRVALLLCTAIAAAGFSRSPDPPRLAGEVDAAGLQKLLAAEKGRVVLVNFWATWCVPCREEFPDLTRLQRTHGRRGLRVIGVSTDLDRELPGVEKFLARQKPAFPNYRKKIGGDDQIFIDAVDRSWGGELPFSVLYGRDGRKVRVLSGKHSYAEYEREIRPLLSP
jgi:thiol-disulfide isomerase/thioredoxin